MNSSTTRHHTTLLSELKANFGGEKNPDFLSDWLRALFNPYTKILSPNILINRSTNRLFSNLAIDAVLFHGL